MQPHEVNKLTPPFGNRFVTFAKQFLNQMNLFLHVVVEFVVLPPGYRFLPLVPDDGCPLGSLLNLLRRSPEFPKDLLAFKPRELLLLPKVRGTFLGPAGLEGVQVITLQYVVIPAQLGNHR